MFEFISRSIEITKKTLTVLASEKKLLVFPILSAFFSILLAIALIVPAIGIAFLFPADQNPLGSIPGYVLLFIFYLVTSTVAIFFNVALVRCVKNHLEKKPVSIGDGISFAFSRLFSILKWAFMVAIVGIILNIIESAIEKRFGSLASGLVRGLLGGAWSLVTFFVIPILAYEEIGIIEAMKKSLSTIQKTWGESVALSVGVGIATFLAIIAWIILSVILAILIPSLIMFIVALFIIGIILLLLLSTTLSKIYQVLLYVYATNEQKVPEGFTSEELKTAFTTTKK